MRKVSWLKIVVFLGCLTPALYLAWLWYQDDLGINRLERVARYTGGWALRFLLASLAITPLRRITGWNALIRYRRMLGLYAFAYGLFHGFHYFAFDAQWYAEVIIEDLTLRRFFIAGAIALALMIPLAATSFTAAIRWLGGVRWRQLHRLVYLSAIAAVVHYLWQAKGVDLEPLYYAAVLAILLLARVVFAIQKRWPRRRPAAG